MSTHTNDGNKSTTGINTTITAASSSKDEGFNKLSNNNISSSSCSSITPITHTIHIVDNKNILKLDIATITEMTAMVTDKRIVAIKKLFRYELRQIDIIIALISKGKDIGFILGMSLKDIINGLKNYDKFFLYKSKSYIHTLLEQMRDSNVSLLEYSKHNSLYNINTFSLAYYNHDEKQEFSRYLV